MSESERRGQHGSGRSGRDAKGQSLAAPATAFAKSEKTRAELERELAAARGRIEALEETVARRDREREDVRAAERRLAETAENLPGIIFRRVLHPNGRITYEHVAGRSYAKSYGIEMPQGHEDSDRVFGRIHLDDRDALKSAITTSAASMEPLDFEYRKMTSRGEIHWERATGRPRKMENGDIVWDSIAIDITAQKRAESELLETKQRFQAILDNVPCMIWIKGEDDRYALANREFLDRFGLASGEVEGRTDHEIFPREIADQYRIDGRAIRATGIGRTVEQQVPQGGEVRTRLSVQFPMEFGDGKRSAVCGISTDITERKQTEDALRESEARLAEAHRLAHLGHWEIDYESGWSHWSDENYRILGYAPQSFEPSHEHAEQCIHPDDREAFREAWGQALDGDGSYAVDLRIVRPDGTERMIQSRGEFTFASSGEPTRAFGTIMDITERKRTENALRESEALLQAIIDNSPAVISLKDRDGRHILASPAHKAVFGVEAADVLGKTSHELVAAETADRLMAHDRMVFESGEATEQEDTIQVAGRTSTILTVKFPIPDNDGKVTRIGAMVTDITKRKQAEQSLRDSEAWLRAIIDNSPASIALKDLEGRHILISLRTEEIFGVAAEDVLGKTTHELAAEGSITPALAESLVAEDRKLLADGRPVEKHDEVRLADGAHTIHTTKFPVSDGAGKITAIGAISTDITERRQAEEGLRNSEARLRAIVDHSPVSIAVKDLDGRFIVFSAHTKDLMGVAPEDMLSKTSHDWAPKDVAESLIALDRTVLDTGRTAECEYELGLTDDEHTFHTVKFPVLDGTGEITAIGGITTDITERKRSVERLRESEARLNLALSAAHSGTWHQSLDDDTGYWDEQTEAIFGLEPGGFGGTIEAFLEFVHPDDRARVLEENRRSQREGVPYEGEYRIIRADGSVGHVISRASTIRDEQGEPLSLTGVMMDMTEYKEAERALRESEERLNLALGAAQIGTWVRELADDAVIWDERSEAIFGLAPGAFEGTFEAFLGRLHPNDRDRTLEGHRQSIEEDAPYNMEYRAIWPDGTVHHVISRASAVRDEGGAATRITGVLLDVTEHKEAEDALAAAREELAKREKLAVLGQLTATVSHEIRNPLGTMRSSIHVIRQKLAEEDPLVVRAVDRIDRNITRCDRIIDELLDFTRTRGFEPQPVEIDPWLFAVLEEQSVPEGITVEFDLKAPGLVIPIDGDRLRRAIINVYENACQAMAGPDEPRGTAPGSRLRMSTTVGDARLEITLADTGPGIAADVLPKIFEPLFSSKSFGVGLGLPVVRQILELHGGGVEVESETGGGTRFRLWLPVSAPEGEERP